MILHRIRRFCGGFAFLGIAVGLMYYGVTKWFRHELNEYSDLISLVDGLSGIFNLALAGGILCLILWIALRYIDRYRDY